MTATKFATASFISGETGATVTGEYICETSTAYQVAVKGKVRLLMKDEWTGTATADSPFGGQFDDLLNGRFAG